MHQEVGVGGRGCASLGMKAGAPYVCLKYLKCHGGHCREQCRIRPEDQERRRDGTGVAGSNYIHPSDVGLCNTVRTDQCIHGLFKILFWILKKVVKGWLIWLAGDGLQWVLTEHGMDNLHYLDDFLFFGKPDGGR